MAVNGTDHFADLKKKYGTKPTTAAQPRETRSRSSAVTAAPKDYFAELKEKYPGSSAPTATQKAPGSGNKLSLAHTWLDNYINETMRPEDYDWELEKAGKDLQAAQEELHRLSTVGGADYFTQEEIARSTQLKKTIEQLTQKSKELESQKKYRFLSENPDFAEKSKPSTASRKSNYFDVLLQTKDYQYDAVNGYLRDIQGEARENGNATMAYAIGAVYGNYAYISPEERAIYNYLYNTQGADSAGEYMDHIKNTLSERSQKYTLEEWEKLAKEMPVSTSIASVPMSLWGGIGYLGAVGEKAVRDISGDYMTPINYNSAAMMPGKMSSAIRKTVSQDLVDRYGVIRLNEEKYPTLSKLLNGKSWADVYQLGMGMVDSTAVALMSPVLGPHGTLLLAGNAATQTMLTAVENGASDDQALMLGALSGSFEYLFEKYELESLLGKSDDVLRKLFTQALSEGFGEGMTSIANLAADTLVMADKSELSRLAAEYMKNDPGMSEEAAMKKALADLAIQVGWDTVGGMFTGGIMGGGKAVIDTLSDRTQQPQSDPQAPVAPQAENGQTTQETAAEPTSGSLEWVQELNELGAETEATQQPASKEQMLQEVIGEVLGLDTSASADVGAVEQTQKNTTQTSGNKYHLRGYSQQQKDNWKSSKRIVLYEGIEQFKNFIKNALSGKIQTNKKLYFGAVDSDLASAISTETGVNVEGYNLALGENEIRKINKDHGNEQTEAPRGQRAVTEADYLGIPDVVQSPDSIKLSSKLYEGKPVIEFRKTNGNETTVVSAVVSDKRLDLFVQTTYVNKKRGSIATPESEQADSNTPEATGGTAPDKDVTQSPAEGQTTNHGTNAQSAIVSPSSNNSIPQTTPGVNTNSAETPAPTDSMGAAPSGFDPNSHLQYQYGTLPEGKNAVRPDDLPVSTDGTNRVSQTAVTVKGAKVTSDEFSDLLTKDVTERNGMTYIPITNNATVQKAIDFISEEGWEKALGAWQADVRAGKAGADMSATGALLLNNAAKAGDKAAWLEILHDYQLLGTNTAQGMQALQILKKLSPSDKLYMAKRSVKQMVRDMKLDADITIDPELEAEYNAAETDEQRDAVLKKIQKDIARQLPTTFMEKITAWRYLSMLGNLRTQARNVVGNLTMMGTRAIHNAVATGIERIANWASHGKIGRTRSVIVNKEQMAAGMKDFDSLQDHILDGGKFNDNMTATGFARGVQEQKRIFAFKPLEGYRKVTNWMMEQGDIIFARQAYARALAGYLKANGVTEADFSKVDPAIMDDARLFAAKEAQEATFRDTNWLSGWVSKIGRRKDTPAVGRLLSEGIMPFRKTPANVLVRAEEYSPLGVINSVMLSVQAAKKGSDVTANQVINSWAKTLTGTGLFGMGMLLQCLGLLSAGPDEDEQKDGFEDLNGWQDYALTLPDGTNLTIDCFSPSAIPVLMGAQLMQQIGEGGFQLKDLEKALTSIADPLVEMSMLQGVNALLENIQYADSNLGQFAINAATSYLTQVLTNTLAGQLERSFEDSRQQTYVDKDSQLPAWLQRTLGKASAKIPGLDYNQIPYINAWGEEEENPPAGLNLIYNLLSPSYISKGIDNALTRELNRLNDVQSDVNVYPATPDKTVTIKKQVYHVSADEYVQLAKLQGQTQKQIVEDLIANSDYASLSDEDKAKAIREAYDYARDYARGEVVKDHPGITTKWMKEIGDDVAEGIIRHITADGKYTSLSVSDASYVDDLLAGLVAEKGKTNVRDIQRIEAIADSELSEKDQKAVLKDTLDDGAYEKYLRILATGVDTDDYALSYRLYLDAEGGTGKKERIISSFQRELDVSRRVAEKLYDIYSGKK